MKHFKNHFTNRLSLLLLLLFFCTTCPFKVSVHSRHRPPAHTYSPINGIFVHRPPPYSSSHSTLSAVGPRSGTTLPYTSPYLSRRPPCRPPCRTPCRTPSSHEPSSHHFPYLKQKHFNTQLHNTPAPGGDQDIAKDIAIQPENDADDADEDYSQGKDNI